MFKMILWRVRQPESQAVLWGFPLPVWLTVTYVITTLVGLLMVTTWREDSLSDPDAASLILAGIIGGALTVWAVFQNVRQAIIEAKETSKKKAETPNVQDLLSLKESQSRPLWIVWLIAFAVAVTLDTVAVLLGKPQNSFMPGLDRISGASWATWVLAALLYVIVRPAAEELIFRGILYPVLARRLSDNVQAVAASAGLFTLLHLGQVFNENLGWQVTYWGLVYPLVLGWVAGIARAHTKSTPAAIGTHAMFGLFMVLNALVTFA